MAFLIFAGMEFYDLTVAEVVRETEDCISVRFYLEDNLKSDFTFIPGQYLSVEKEINGELVRRSYSICSHPEEGLRVAIKRIDGGLFSSWASQNIKRGDTLSVSLPDGNFTHEVNPANDGNYVAFAAGSGITPVLSIIKSVLKDEPKSTFTLFYGNRTSNDIIFKEELEGLKNKHMERFQLFHLLSKEETESDLTSGRIDPQKCDAYFKYFIPPRDVSRVFLCGPYDMIMGMKDALTSLDIDSSKIKFELFFNPKAEHGSDIQKTDIKKISNKVLKITVDGLTSEIHPTQDMSVLDIAIDAGLDMPFSCKGGVCATCKAKIVEGEVEMVTNFALEEEEVEQGFVLTCQAHIRSDFVNVNYDVI